MIRTKLILARFNKDGKLIEHREQESRSWLKHFFDMLYILHNTNVSLANVNDIGGTPREIYYQLGAPSNTLQVGAPPGNIFLPSYTGGSVRPAYDKGEKTGIVVGTGALAVTPLQDALQTKIAHGEAAGQLLYGGCELYGLTFANPNGQFTIRRYFTNVLGGAVAVVEAGIYTIAIVGGATAYNFCIARDVFAAVTVNNGEILRVTYVVQITV